MVLGTLRVFLSPKVVGFFLSASWMSLILLHAFCFKKILFLFEKAVYHSLSRTLKNKEATDSVCKHFGSAERCVACAASVLYE